MKKVFLGAMMVLSLTGEVAEARWSDAERERNARLRAAG